MNTIKPENFSSRMVLKAETASVSIARSQVEEFLRSHELPGDFIFNMALVVSEAIANAVSHGSCSSESEVVLSIQIVENSFQILVEDFQGREFDPEYFRRIAMVKDWGKGGRGIMMMETIMDNMSYIIEEGRHTMLFLEKALPSTS
jgi:anti-sigma regulatory factor (Ser/Thr protein kinase)